MSTDKAQTTDLDAAAKIMARLVMLLPERDRGMSAVFDALLWLRKHDHPGLWLNATTRELMEALK